jgi:hypothetical protein
MGKFKTKEDSINKAKAAIERRHYRCLDICDGVGQMFDNVKHMRWFIEMVANELYPIKESTK